MKNPHPTFRVPASFVLLFVLTTVAQALPFRTWVAGNGNDANPCTLALPCQTFAAAITQTAAGGEVNVKNAGAFGMPFIDKSLTIDGGGAFSDIPFFFLGTGIIISDSASATPNTAVVTLRNLSISGATLATNGVYFFHGKTLNIENCRISNFSSAGVYISLPISGNVTIKNTSIFNATNGVVVSSAAPITLSLNGCNIEQNTDAGVKLSLRGYASIRDSVIQFNGIGVTLSIANSSVNIVDSQINNNTTGLSVGMSMTATIGSSTFMDNGTNFSNSGRIYTFGNNQTDTNPIPGVVTNLGLR